MKQGLLLSIAAVVGLSACAVQEQACQDINEITEQAQECKLLQRQLNQSKDQPLVLAELERRYQTNCIDVHFYREDRQIAICDNKQEIEGAIKEYEDKLEQENKEQQQKAEAEKSLQGSDK